MQTTIDRIRPQYERLMDPQYIEGRRKGREWAESSAEARHFYALALRRDRCSSPAVWLQQIPDQVISPARVVATMIIGTNGYGDASPQQAREFFAPLGMDPEGPAELYQGFADGVLAVWRQLEMQL